MHRMDFLMSLLISLPFLIIALYTFKRSRPVNFWAGDVIEEEELIDVKSYNRANALLWFISGVIVLGLSLYTMKMEHIGSVLLQFWSLES